MSDGKAPEGGVDLTALKALAEKATKGKRSWCTSGETPCDILLADGQEVLWDDWYRTKPEDHDFIAACDPDTILALIAEVEAARERRCETCAEWEAGKNGNLPPGDWGTCALGRQTWRDGVERCAVVVDVDDPCSEGSIWTRPDFGCNQWRAKE